MKDKTYFKSTVEDKLKLQSGANERYHDQIFDEMEELKHDLWRYQNARDEARRLQSSGKLEKSKEGAGPAASYLL